MAADDDFGFDLSKLFPQVPGLLSADDRKAAVAQGLLGLSAGLLKAGGTPSPVKGGSWGRGIGEGVEGLLSGYQNAQNSALKNQLVRGQLTTQSMGIYQKLAEMRALGLDGTPEYQQLARLAGGMMGPGASASQLAPTVPSLSSASPATAGAPGTPTGTAAPMVPRGTDATPTLAAPAGATPPQPSAVGAPAAGAPAAGKMSLTDWAKANNINPYFLMPGSPMAGELAKAYSAYLTGTNEQRNANDPSVRTFQRNTESDKAESAAERKRYDAILGGISTGANMEDLGHTGRIITEQPTYTGGMGADAMTAGRRFLGMFGINGAASTPNEVFSKVTAEGLLARIGQMREDAGQMGGSAGRMFVGELNTMAKAVPNTDMSTPAGRLLMMQMERIGQRMQSLGQAAIDYRAQHGRLDNGWDKIEADMVNPRKNPIFTDDELHNMLGGSNPDGSPAPGAVRNDQPVQPPGGSRAPSAVPVRVKTPEEADRLPKGTPIVLPDGRTGVVP